LVSSKLNFFEFRSAFRDDQIVKRLFPGFAMGDVEPFRFEPGQPVNLGVGQDICPHDAGFERDILHAEQVAVDVDINMKGGILAWSDTVDPSVPKY
jgi:hypothetical protein